MMEGLDYVKDGDKASFGPGYWLMDVIHFSKDHEMTPLLNKLYSFDHGAKSENKEIMETIEEVDSIIDKDVTNIFDRGMDRSICRDWVAEHAGNIDNSHGHYIFVAVFAPHKTVAAKRNKNIE